MARARKSSLWENTGEILAATYNTIRDPKKRQKPFVGSDFNPYATVAPKKRKGIEAFGALIGMSQAASRKAAAGIKGK